MELTNEAKFHLSMITVTDLYFSSLISCDEYDRIRAPLYDEYKPNAVIRSYADFTEEEWINLLKRK